MWRPTGIAEASHVRERLFDYGSVILQPGETSVVSFELHTHRDLAVATSTGDK
jgi:hypothetical protein